MDLNYMDLLNSLDSFIWGPPLLVLLVGTGILLTIRLKLLQVFQLPKALKLIFKAQNAGSVILILSKLSAQPFLQRWAPATL